MKFDEAWLRAWIDPPVDTAGLADQLTSLGLEVDRIESARPAFENVVVGRIVTAEPHPDADRLRVCTVDAGEDEPVQVVCGAPNARVGLATAFARVGGRLPDGTKLKKAKLRGVVSHGMLCSVVELGLGEDRAGIMELDDDAPPGTDLATWLGLDGSIFEVELTPDRGDCLSIRGLARDLSAKNDLPMSRASGEPLAASIDDTLPVSIDEASACARFTGRVVRGIDPGAPVPEDVAERLHRSGIRSIDAAVDVTAHVMLELGQPMHAFDLDKLTGGIRVRLAEVGERLVLLDGREVGLDAETTVIADDSGAIAIAGIMGGRSTMVDAGTRNVYLESALFLPGDLIGKPRRYALHTDASHRFERGVDPEGQREALEAATALLVSIAGGAAGPVGEVVVDARLPVRKPVTLRASRLARVLGVPVSAEETLRILGRLGVRCDEAAARGVGRDAAGPDRRDGDDRAADGHDRARAWQVTAPSHRWDLAVEEDFIEEVARVRGFDSLPRTLPVQRPGFRPMPETRVPPVAIKRVLAQRGYQEVVTYSFVDGERQARLRPDLAAIDLPNPISSELGAMRTTLVTGLLDVYRRNAARQLDAMRLFETGLRFLADGRDAHLAPRHGDDLQIDDTLRQQDMIAGLAVGRREPEGWNTAPDPVDFYAIKADVEALLSRAAVDGITFGPSELAMLHPGQRASIVVGGESLGHVGALNPALQEPLDLPGLPYVFELSGALSRRAGLPAVSPLSRFPRVRRDLALLVDERLSRDALIATVRGAASASLQDAFVFDVYRGDGLESGRKSIGLGLILQDFSRTLEERDVDRAVRRVVVALEREHGAALRD